MLKLKKGDLWLIAVLVAVGILWLGLRYFNEQSHTYNPADLNAVITVDGQLYKTVPLNGATEQIEIKTEFGHNILKKFDGGIQMIFADCPKKFPWPWDSYPGRMRPLSASRTGSTWKLPEIKVARRMRKMKWMLMSVKRESPSLEFVFTSHPQPPA